MLCTVLYNYKHTTPLGTSTGVRVMYLYGGVKYLYRGVTYLYGGVTYL